MGNIWKKILIIALYVVLTASVVGYFYGAELVTREGRKREICKEVKITLLDSALNRFVTKQEIIDIINRFKGETVGKHIDSIDLKNLEILLNKRSVVKESQIYITRDGCMNVEIKQRKPIIRIQTNSGGYYIDETAFIFPLIENYSSYVPIVTGDLPIDIKNDEIVGRDSIEWINKIFNLGKFLEKNHFWNAQIEQINFNTKSSIELYTRVGGQKIIFGDIKDLEEKFAKLYAFYNNIIPQFGWNRYETIDISFKNQIVCKKNKNK